MADDIIVTINNLYLYVQNLIPNVETQVMFDEATQNKWWILYRKTSNIGYDHSSGNWEFPASQ